MNKCYKNFEKVIKLILRANEYIDQLTVLGIDLIESPLYEAFGIFADTVIMDNYTVDGVDTINEWLYETKDSERCSIEDLYNKVSRWAKD